MRGSPNNDGAGRSQVDTQLKSFMNLDYASPSMTANYWRNRRSDEIRRQVAIVGGHGPDGKVAHFHAGFYKINPTRDCANSMTCW